ncbi:Eukaryotic translation initiation factor 3 subunit A, partial [Dissostichus eleginoides]
EEEVQVVVYVLANGAHLSVGSWVDCRDGQQSGGGSERDCWRHSRGAASAIQCIYYKYSLLT